MKYTIPTKGKVCASSTFSISSINATKVCKVLNRKKFSYAKSFLEKLVRQEATIKGRYYSKTSKDILKLLEQLENNARSRNVDTTSMKLFISAHRGPTRYRSRRRRKHGLQLKLAHIQAVLSDKNGFGKEVH